MFQFAGFASLTLFIHVRIPLMRWVAPFGDLRVIGYLRLTVAFRSLSRPSSPLGA